MSCKNKIVLIRPKRETIATCLELLYEEAEGFFIISSSHKMGRR